MPYENCQQAGMGMPLKGDKEEPGRSSARRCSTGSFRHFIYAPADKIAGVCGVYACAEMVQAAIFTLVHPAQKSI